jgi:hypothetical protein
MRLGAQGYWEFHLRQAVLGGSVWIGQLQDRQDKMHTYEWLDGPMGDERGHGVQIHEGSIGEAFVEGYEWNRNASAAVRIRLYRHALAKVHIKESDLKSILVQLIEDRKLKHGAIGHGISALFNA